MSQFPNSIASLAPAGSRPAIWATEILADLNDATAHLDGEGLADLHKRVTGKRCHPAAQREQVLLVVEHHLKLATANGVDTRSFLK